MTAPIDYQAVLVDLEAKRAQIEAAILGIRIMLGSAVEAEDRTSQVDAPPKPPAPRQPAPVTANGLPVQTDTFFGMTTAQAVKKFLAMSKRPQTPRAIADALHAGGQVHAIDPKTAYTNAYTALKRGKDGEFSQTRNGEWGLAEWYSNKPKGEGE
ncbi:MAG: hypothetical protein ABIT20_05010 [Gemmatimonadaceae bacterium]